MRTTKYAEIKMQKRRSQRIIFNDGNEAMKIKTLAKASANNIWVICIISLTSVICSLATELILMDAPSWFYYLLPIVCSFSCLTLGIIIGIAIVNLTISKMFL